MKLKPVCQVRALTKKIIYVYTTRTRNGKLPFCFLFLQMRYYIYLYIILNRRDSSIKLNVTLQICFYLRNSLT